MPLVRRGPILVHVGLITLLNVFGVPVRLRRVLRVEEVLVTAVVLMMIVIVRWRRPLLGSLSRSEKSIVQDQIAL